MRRAGIVGGRGARASLGCPKNLTLFRTSDFMSNRDNVRIVQILKRPLKGKVVPNAPPGVWWTEELPAHFLMTFLMTFPDDFNSKNMHPRTVKGII